MAFDERRGTGEGEDRVVKTNGGNGIMVVDQPVPDVEWSRGGAKNTFNFPEQRLTKSE